MEEVRNRANELLAEFSLWFANANEVDNLEDLGVIGDVLRGCSLMLDNRLIEAGVKIESAEELIKD